MAKESKFQSDLKKDIKNEYPGCYVFKTDALQYQGIPDITILYKDKWAMLECKKSADARHRPNQDYYVNRIRNEAYASFIYPENRDEVLQELRDYFNKEEEH